ncbi:MAG TPA: hypothetical protein EYN05_06895 [Nitrospinaceae bacterium]|nr:hypothetical protein [Nitrospinaceae bacterium]
MDIVFVVVFLGFLCGMFLMGEERGKSEAEASFLQRDIDAGIRDIFGKVVGDQKYGDGYVRSSKASPLSLLRRVLGTCCSEI